MKLSDKRQSDLYAAVSNNIMKLRIMNERALKAGTTLDFDLLLFDLGIDIWHEVAEVLNLSHP